MHCCSTTLQKHYGTTYSPSSAKKDLKKNKAKKKAKKGKDDSSEDRLSSSLEFVDTLEEDLMDEELQIEPPKKQKKYRSFKDENESSMEITSSNAVPDKQVPCYSVIYRCLHSPRTLFVVLFVLEWSSPAFFSCFRSCVYLKSPNGS